MTLRGTVQVNSEAIGAIAVLRNRSYTFLRKNYYFRTGHEKQEFVCFYRFMTRNKRRTVDL